MSLRPGIGADAMWDVASEMMRYRLRDVPVSLTFGGRDLPLGRYLRRLLRERVGLPVNAPPEYVEALRQGLLPLFECAEEISSKSPGVFRAVAGELIEEQNKQYALNLAAKLRVKNRRPL